MDPIKLNIFSSRINAICDEMGSILKRFAFSPNIRDRLDFSCAIFDCSGHLCAQAAHIPVHLGSMAFAMVELVNSHQWQDGEMIIVNDPFLGGTHLPDVTIISPVFIKNKLSAFVANRAHHADIGCDSPGSMPLSTHLDEEGLVIPPSVLIKADGTYSSLHQDIMSRMRNPTESAGDFSAQVAANIAGRKRLIQLIQAWGIAEFDTTLNSLNEYAERLAISSVSIIPDGEYSYQDSMETEHDDVSIKLNLIVENESITADFTGTTSQISGNINCPLSVTAAAVYYVFRCLMPSSTPACAGSLRPVKMIVPQGSLLNARRPAAVAAGNVETSTRVTDVVLGALSKAIPDQIPAASHGSMNNVAMGNSDVCSPWDYYETIGGGMGASPVGDGLSAIQTHMTNTLNTPVESLEMSYPLRIKRYAVRRHSGGTGKHHGGDGLIREFEFLEPASVTLISERRESSPWGLNGGHAGKKGLNLLNGKNIGGKASLNVKAGDILSIYTPGGGGWGKGWP